jgi:exopolysaccharide biosynthesis polyprenyl glycosylphosphotransferase
MKNGARTLILLLGDVLVLALSFVLMLKIAFYSYLAPQALHSHILPFSILSVLWIIIFFIFDLYNTQATSPTIPHLRKIFLAFGVALLIGGIFFYSIPSFGISPKENLLVFTIVAFVIFMIWRRFFYVIFSAYFRKRIVFITGINNKSRVNDLYTYIKNYPQSGLVIVGEYESYGAFAKEYTGVVPEVIIISKETWRDGNAFKKLYNSECEVMDLAYAYEDILGRVPVDAIDEDWFIHNIRSHRKQRYDKEKWIIGFIFSLILLIILSPIFLLIAICIKISDRGPVFYTQLRVGKGGKDFKLYKFRSMVINAENEGATWSTKNDPRVTKIGRFLRKSHIDELPQMLNVLKGDMSLVGPRPERPSFVTELEKSIPFYHLRHIISPGFTGWAQIKFRYARTTLDSKEKFEYDLYYLKKRNIPMDLGIILKTIQIIFTH